MKYADIFDDTVLSVGIFIMRKGATIPLHDHPSMHVLSKVLCGRTRIQSFDFDDDGQGAARGSPRRALLREDVELTPESGVHIVYPRNCNLHTITALTDTAFLDVLGPPYDSEQRTCTYYVPVPAASPPMSSARSSSSPAPAPSPDLSDTDAVSAQAAALSLSSTPPSSSPITAAAAGTAGGPAEHISPHPVAFATPSPPPPQPPSLCLRATDDVDFAIGLATYHGPRIVPPRKAAS